MPKSCGCSNSGTSGPSGLYEISYGTGQTKTFRSDIAANAFIAQTPGAVLVSSPPPAGG